LGLNTVPRQIFRVPSSQRTDFTCFADRARSTVTLGFHRGEKSIALKLCKPEQHVEASEVSWQDDTIFHTLINTCVENLILQKYFLSSSAQRLP
jgi:hypothetical protein